MELASSVKRLTPDAGHDFHRAGRADPHLHDWIDIELRDFRFDLCCVRFSQITGDCIGTGAGRLSRGTGDQYAGEERQTMQDSPNVFPLGCESPAGRGRSIAYDPVKNRLQGERRSGHWLGSLLSKASPSVNGDRGAQKVICDAPAGRGGRLEEDQDLRASLFNCSGWFVAEATFSQNTVSIYATIQFRHQPRLAALPSLSAGWSVRG